MHEFHGFHYEIWQTAVGITQRRTLFSLNIYDDMEMARQYLSGYSTVISAHQGAQRWIDEECKRAKSRQEEREREARLWRGDRASG